MCQASVPLVDLRVRGLGTLGAPGSRLFAACWAGSLVLGSKGSRPVRVFGCCFPTSTESNLDSGYRRVLGYIRGFPKGVPSWGSVAGNPIIRGTLLGVPYFRKLPYGIP